MQILEIIKNKLKILIDMVEHQLQLEEVEEEDLECIKEDIPQHQLMEEVDLCNLQLINQDSLYIIE